MSHGNILTKKIRAQKWGTTTAVFTGSVLLFPRRFIETGQFCYLVIKKINSVHPLLIIIDMHPICYSNQFGLTLMTTMQLCFGLLLISCIYLICFPCCLPIVRMNNHSNGHFFLLCKYWKLLLRCFLPKFIPVLCSFFGYNLYLRLISFILSSFSWLVYLRAGNIAAICRHLSVLDSHSSDR